MKNKVRIIKAMVVTSKDIFKKQEDNTHLLRSSYVQSLVMRRMVDAANMEEVREWYNALQEVSETVSFMD